MFAQPIPAATRAYLLSHSRLLERQCWLALFEDRPMEMALRALAAYQNPDGSFGNGIDPDLLTPAGTLAALEAACYYLDVLKAFERCRDQAALLVERARGWLEQRIEKEGGVLLPERDIRRYPHLEGHLQQNPLSLLTIAGYFAKFNHPLRGAARKLVEKLAESAPLPNHLAPDNHALFVYAAYETAYPRWAETLAVVQQLLTEHIYEERSTYFLLTRSWYHFFDMMPEELAEQQVERFFLTLKPDGGVPDPDPRQPARRPIVTLDYLMMLDSLDLLDHSFE